MKPITCFSVLFLFIGFYTYAQNGRQQAQPPQPQILMPKPPRRVGNPALRYEVNAKRTGTNMNSDDALPRSREFIRIDSSYYVGWMYEGAYKFNHAADFIGYKNAEAPLEKALRQIERDYRPELATRTHNLFEYINNCYHLQTDYSNIVNYLNQCYLNTEEPEKNMRLLRRYIKWNFQVEFFDAYNYLMWVTHRNRFYTHEKYSFLKNSIAENEVLANSYLDTNLRRIAKNAQFNTGMLNAGYDANFYFGVYHYKSLLYAYSLKVDSAQRYFDLLRNSTIFPHNNYATFRAINGDFREAEAEYKLAQFQDNGDKRLQEYAYYSSILDIYKGLPKIGELRMKAQIQANGSTPGFGWYNIALARCLLYDGQIDESIRHADRAAGFKELHIGTTLGQSHYDFSIQLSKLMTKSAAYEMQRFEHSGWWYSPNVMVNMVKLAAERYLQAFLIINQFAQNPERDQVIYRLFSTESTISWDEVYALISNFSTRYFIRKFSKSAQEDPRPAIRKYFKLMVARLHVQEGDYKEAEPILNELLREPGIDLTYEKLFLARTYEALAKCADGREKPAERDEWLYKLYQVYPQLVPFSGMKMPIQLQIIGTPDAAVTDRLKDCNIRFDAAGGTRVRAQLRFIQKGQLKMVEYSVIDGLGNLIVPKQIYSYTKADIAGVSLAYRLFGIGGAAPVSGEDAT